MSKLNIILFGGAFDPVHNGHLQVARTALTQLVADQVWFVPSGVPPLKKEVMFSFDRRLEFLKAVIKDNPRFYIYENDFQENERSYTILLIQKLNSLYPNHKFSFLIGADNVMNLQNWYEYEKLLELIDFVVINRDTADSEKWHSLEYFHKLKFLKMPLCDVSSSQIREYIQNGKNIKDMLPEALWEIL